MPIHTEPWIWPSTASGLMARPQSSATQTLSTRDHAGVVVDADLDHLRGVAEAHGRADGAAAMLAALEFGRAGEGALDGDGAAVDQRGRDHVGEGQAA